MSSVSPLSADITARPEAPLALPPPGSRCRLLITPHASGVFNMALDERLMAAAREDDCWIVRIYGWATPTVSFGKNQAAVKAYSPDRIREHGYDVVRRPTGGRAILHHREITYSVVAPLARAGDLRQSYSTINTLLLLGLQRMGVPVRAAADGPRGIPPGMTPCFDHPSDGELVVGNRKLVGSAQWRSPDALLQHGSILIDDDQSILNSLLLPSVVAPMNPPPAATLRGILGSPPSLEQVAETVFAVIRERFDSADELAVNTVDDDALRALVDHYTSDEWTWRR